MSALKSFFKETFFMSGTEGIILLTVCIVAIVCTLIVAALEITVIVLLSRRKRENRTEVSEPVQTPLSQQAEKIEPAETLAATPTETLAATPTETFAEPPTETPEKIPAGISAAIFANGGLRYNKSFTAKLIQSDDEVKEWYGSLKNALLGYKKVTSRISRRADSINRGRIKLAKFAIRGKTLRLYLALNPEDYADSKYKVERAAEKRYEEVPCMYRIKNARRAKYALELIAVLAEKFGLKPAEREEVNYYLPYEEIEPLLERGLVKEMGYAAPVRVEEDGEIVEEVAEKAAAAEVPEEEPTEKRTVPLFDRNGVQYNRSFTAKLIQSDDEVKEWYAQIKNEILSYKKVRARMSWRRESFRSGRKVVARLGYRGNTLCVYLPLDPAEYADSKFKVEDVSDYAAYADTPCLYRIKNAIRARYAKDLVAIVMGNIGAARNEEYAPDNAYVPYEETEPLIARGLIKVVYGTPKQSILQENAEEVEEVAAETAAAEVPEDEQTEEIIAETAEEGQPAEEAEVVAEEQPVEEVYEEVKEQPAEEVEEVPQEQPAEEEAVTETTEEQPVEEVAEEVAEEPTEKVEEVEEVPEEVPEEVKEEPVVEEVEVEELSKKEIKDVQSYEERTNDEDGIEVVGVMFRRRGRKVYWFDPDGKTWQKGEIALYKSPDNPPQEVIVVDNAKLSPSKLHLPLKPLCKVNNHRQPNKK